MHHSSDVCGIGVYDISDLHVPCVAQLEHPRVPARCGGRLLTIFAC